MKDTIVIYYSRTGVSQTVAQAVAEKLKCPIIQVYYPDHAKISFLWAGKQSTLKQTCTIQFDPIQEELSGFQRVIFVFPIWAFTLSTPIRSFMVQFKSDIKNYDLIATAGGSGLTGCVKDASVILGKPPKNSIMLRDQDIRKGEIHLPEWV